MPHPVHPHHGCTLDGLCGVMSDALLFSCILPARHGSSILSPLLPPRSNTISNRIKMATVLSASTAARFKLVFFVPPLALEKCKAAIFAAGAGRYPGAGNYTECCWTTTGTGQFRPGDAARPHIGAVGRLEQVEEIRVETLCCGDSTVKKAVEALKA